jgi:hypothetical protein
MLIWRLASVVFAFMSAPCPSPASEVTEVGDPPFNHPSMESQILYGACRRVRRKTSSDQRDSSRSARRCEEDYFREGISVIIGAMFGDGSG